LKKLCTPYFLYIKRQRSIMFDLVSKAASSLPQIPFLSSTGDVTGRVCSVLPDVPTLPSMEDVSVAVRRSGERVLDSVDNNVKYGSTLTRGVTYCGAAVSNLPLIGSSIRPFVPQRDRGDGKEQEKEDNDQAQDFNQEDKYYHRDNRESSGEGSIEIEQSAWKFLQNPANSLTAASSFLPTILDQVSFTGLSGSLTKAALKTSISASVMTLNATNNLFKEYTTQYSRVLNCNPALYCREKSAVEATQYFLRFAVANLTKLFLCSPKEVVRALAMYGALQKVLGTPYPPAEPVLNLNTMEGKVEFETLRRVFDFVLATYGPLILDILRMNLTSRSMDDLIIRMTEVSKEDILVSCSTSKFQQPAYAVVLDRKYKRIVVAVRGTANIEDCLTDVHAQVAPFHVGHAHQGMLCSAQFLDRTLRALVTKYCRSHRDYEIVVTGHSLGGAVATILAIIWHKDRIIGMKVRGISYAAASCVTKSLAEDCRGFVTSVVYADDLVSRISFRSFEDLRHILVMMCSKEGKLEGVDSNTISTLIEAYITAERSTAPRWHNHLQAIYNKLTALASKQRSDHPLLFPGGQIRYVIPDEDYDLHPERRPLRDNTRLTPKNMYMLAARNLDNLGEIVCNPAVCLRHFPTVLMDFFRPRDLSNIMAGKKSSYISSSGESPQFVSSRGVSMDTSESEDEKMDIGHNAKLRRKRSRLSPRRQSLTNMFWLRQDSV